MRTFGGVADTAAVGLGAEKSGCCGGRSGYALFGDGGFHLFSAAFVPAKASASGTAAADARARAGAGCAGAKSIAATFAGSAEIVATAAAGVGVPP